MSQMKIQLKLLGREPIIVKVTPETLIKNIKQQIHEYLRISVEEQRLIFEGEILKDDKKIKHYSRIQDNSKVHLIVMVKKKHPLYNKMYEIVRPHCDENETQKILSVFMRKVYDSFRHLSLDDLERIAHEALKKESTDSVSVKEVKQE